MQNYQIVLVFDEQHDKKAINLMTRLQKMGIRVLRSTQYTSGEELEQNIRRADFVFVLLVSDAPFPKLLCENADRMVQQIRDRDKQLYVIKEYSAPLPPDFQGYPLLEPEDGTMMSPQGGGVAGMIFNLVVGAENKQVLYEKLSALIAIDYRPGIQETLSALCELLCKDLLSKYPWTKEPQDEIAEILRIFEQLDQYPTGYGQEQKNLARTIMKAAAGVDPLIRKLSDSEDLYCLACLLRIMELEHVIRASCVDTTTTGDIDLFSKPLPEDYERLSQRFLASLNAMPLLNEFYSPRQCSLILEQAERCGHTEAGFKNFTSAAVRKPEELQAPEPLTQTEQKLHQIAEFMSKGYSLFESMADDQTAADFLRCLKTSFERLKNYCDIVEAKSVSALCIGCIAQIDQQLGRTDDTEDAQGKAGLGLKALLGLKLPQSGEYDVFLSYKHEDEDIARKVYHFLKSKLLNAFFDKITLPELSESDYDEAIMTALDHTRHFVVIITDLAQLESYWIKLEMKTFHHEIVEGRKADANFIILVTDRVFEQIVSSNKVVIPLRYRSCEIMRISDYKNAICGYLSK